MIPHATRYPHCWVTAVCLSFLALVSISCHFNLLTKQKLDWPPLRNRSNDHNNYNNQQPQAQQLQKLCTTTFVTPWTCLMEGQETLSNGPYSCKIHKSSSKGHGLGLVGPVILDGKCRLAFSQCTLNMKTPELCFCFKDFSRGTSWWFFMTILMITQTPRTTILVYQRPNY